MIRLSGIPMIADDMIGFIKEYIDFWSLRVPFYCYYFKVYF